MRIASLTVLALFALALPALAQSFLAGRTYQGMLEVVPAARLQATGGLPTAVRDSDLYIGGYNPALLTLDAGGRVGLSFATHPAGLSLFNASVGTRLGKRRQPVLFQLNGLSYGSEKETDPTGTITGSFSGGDYVFSVGLMRRLGSRWYGGIAPKLAYSSLAGFSAVALALDAGAAYEDTANLLIITALIRNAGVQIKPFFEGERQSLPLDLQLGFSKRFAHVPLRFTITAHNLQQPNLRYLDTADRSFTTQSLIPDTTTQPSSFTGDKIMRHLAFGAEVYLSRSFRVGIGYNHLRRREMQIPAPGRTGIAGFSGGFALRINRFDIAYARSVYSIAGGTNTFTLSTAISRF